MKNIKNFLSLLLIVPFSTFAQSTNTIPLNGLSFFKEPPSNWSTACSVVSDYQKDNYLKSSSGSGILVNELKGNKGGDLITKTEFGDLELEMDFLMPKGSNSGIYLQGRYEVQLADSWGVKNLSYQDGGAVYARWDESRAEGQQGFEGIIPRFNASKAPGLWQHLKISFLAPKFDSGGKKVSNAKIINIILNGVSIVENVELTGPTRGSSFNTESSTGPLRFQGDHGPIAFKNIKYSTTVLVNDKISNDEPENPIILKIEKDPVIMRSFVDYYKDSSKPSKRISHAISVGFPQNVSYSIDLKNGSLFQVWKGGFLDATPMWHSRGDGSSRAIGAKILLDNSPSLAVLASESLAWPDTFLKVDSYLFKEYELDQSGNPTFKYVINNVSIDDKLFPTEDGKVLTRELVFKGNNQENLYYRIANGQNIVALANDMYSINNSEYYIRLVGDKSIKPIIRKAADGNDLLIPIKNVDKGFTFQYSLIW